MSPPGHGGRGRLRGQEKRVPAHSVTPLARLPQEDVCPLSLLLTAGNPAEDEGGPEVRADKPPRVKNHGSFPRPGRGRGEP